MPAKKTTTKKRTTTRKKTTAKKKPAAKKTTRKKSTAKKPAVKKKVTRKKAAPKKTMLKMELPLEPVKNDQPAICRSCHALPVGSVEIVSLLLVLVFSLTAVLFTSVYAMEMQQNQIDSLEHQITN